MFSSKPICICIANIHFHFWFMCLPSLLIGFGSFPNVQSVPSNNYIPKEICMNFVTDLDGLSAHHRCDSDILLHLKDASYEAKCQQGIMSEREWAHCCFKTVRYDESPENHGCFTKFTFIQCTWVQFLGVVEYFHLFCFILLLLCHFSEYCAFYSTNLSESSSQINLWTGLKDTPHI